MSTPRTINEVVGLFVKIRDKKAAAEAEHKAVIKALDAKLDILEADLLARLNAEDSNSVSTDHGTVYRSTQMKPSIRDFSALSTWIMETGNFGILQKRVSSTALRDLGEGVEVPGVEVIYEATIGVRRA